MYRFLYILRGSLYITLLFACLVVSGRQNAVRAFSEDFTSDPTGNPNWLVQNAVGLTFNSPGITLTSNNSGSFPYLKTSNLVDISSDTHYEVTFQYMFTGSPWGVGGSFTDNAPNYPTYLGTINDYLSYNIAYFWGDKLHSVTSLCPISSSTCPNTWWFIYPNQVPSNTYSSSTISDYLVHTFKMVRTSVDTDSYSYRIYMDENLIFESKPTIRLVNSIWLGHPSNIGGSKSWPILKIFSIRSYPDTPTSPRAFPFLSQNDPLWANKEYDSASEWAGEDKSGIDRWGCALTSVAMLLQHYGVKTPEGSDVNPDNLNTWLMTQPDGYIGSGFVNWLAIARYVKGRVPGENDSLEFVRSYDKTAVELPSILGVPGHFVLAHDQESINWIVNDPAKTVPDTSLPMTTNVVSVNRFIPSNTDLSYMLFVTDSGVTAVMRDSSDVPVDMYWVDEYLTSDIDDMSGPALQTSMISKPADGRYNLEVTNANDEPSPYVMYLYDEDGGVTRQSYMIPANTTLYFVIDYSSTPNSLRVFRFDYASVFDYLRNLRARQKQGNGIYQALSDKFRDLMTESTTASSVNAFISKQSPKFIAPEVKTQLQTYIELIDED